MRQTHCLRSSSRRATWAAMRALSRSLMLSRLLCAVDVEPINSSTSCLAVSRLSSLCFKLSRMSWASSSLTSPCSSSGVDPGWKLSLDKRWMSWNVSLTESDRTARFADTEWMLMGIKKRKHLLSFSCSLLVIIKGVTSCPALPCHACLANVSSFPTNLSQRGMSRSGSLPAKNVKGASCVTLDIRKNYRKVNLSRPRRPSKNTFPGTDHSVLPKVFRQYDYPIPHLRLNRLLALQSQVGKDSPQFPRNVAAKCSYYHGYQRQDASQSRRSEARPSVSYFQCVLPIRPCTRNHAALTTMKQRMERR